MDGPKQTRRQYNLKRLSLTDLSVTIERGAKKTAFLKAWEEASVDSKFAASAWGKKLAARAKKANLNDLERHAILVKRIKVRPHPTGGLPAAPAGPRARESRLRAGGGLRGSRGRCRPLPAAAGGAPAPARPGRGWNDTRRR